MIAIGIIALVVAGAGTATYFAVQKTSKNIPIDSDPILPEETIETEPLVGVIPPDESIAMPEEAPTQAPQVETALQSPEIPAPYDAEIDTQTSASLPTAQELKEFEWLCTVAPEACTAEARSAFNTDEAFRTLTLEGIIQVKSALANQQKVIADKEEKKSKTLIVPQVSSPINYSSQEGSLLNAPTLPDCSNYQSEKSNMDEYYAQNGTTFSSARTNALNALKDKYAHCF